MANTTYNDWNFKTGPVDGFIGPGGDGNYVGENYVSSESVLICTGPPRFSGLTNVIPIGVIQNFNLGQNKNIQQFFEVGSKDTVLLPGKTFIQATLSRILFNGPSLMKVMMLADSVKNAVPDDDPAKARLSIVDYQLDPNHSPGNGEFFLNLASDAFDKPVGLAMIMHDIDDDAYGGVYLEYVLANTHNLSIAAGQTVIAETMGLRIGKIKPIVLK